MMVVLFVFMIVMGIHCTVAVFTGNKRRSEQRFSDTVHAAISGGLKLIARDPSHVTTAPVANGAHVRQLRFGAFGDGVVVYHVDPRGRRVTINAVAWSW